MYAFRLLLRSPITASRPITIQWSVSARPLERYYSSKRKDGNPEWNEDGYRSEERFQDSVSSHYQRLVALRNNPDIPDKQRNLVDQRLNLLRREVPNLDDVYSGPKNPDYKRFAIKCSPPIAVGQESVTFLRFLKTFGTVIEYHTHRYYAYHTVNNIHISVTFLDPQDEVYDRLFLQFHPFFDAENYATNQRDRIALQKRIGIPVHNQRMFEIERHAISLEQDGLRRSFEIAEKGLPRDQTGSTIDAKVEYYDKLANKVFLGFDGFVK